MSSARGSLTTVYSLDDPRRRLRLSFHSSFSIFLNVCAPGAYLAFPTYRDSVRGTRIRSQKLEFYGSYGQAAVRRDRKFFLLSKTFYYTSLPLV